MTGGEPSAASVLERDDSLFSVSCGFPFAAALNDPPDGDRVLLPAPGERRDHDRLPGLRRFNNEPGADIHPHVPWIRRGPVAPRAEQQIPGSRHGVDDLASPIWVAFSAGRPSAPTPGFTGADPQAVRGDAAAGASAPEASAARATPSRTTNGSAAAVASNGSNGVTLLLAYAKVGRPDRVRRGGAGLGRPARRTAPSPGSSITRISPKSCVSGASDHE